MASRNNQGLQAVVIVLAILVILLGVSLLFVNNAKKTAQARAKDASTKEAETSSAYRGAQSEANTYKQWMGFPEADSYETLQKSFAEDMDGFRANFDENSLFYKPLLENLYEENQKLGMSEVASKEQLRKINETLLAVEKEKDQQIAEANAQATAAKQDAASERKKFGDQYAEMVSEKNEIASQLQEQRQLMDQQAADHRSSVKGYEKKFADMTRHIQVIETRLPDENEFAQPADGRITWVNQKEALVWLNIGQADYLRSQVTFSVYGIDENDAISATRKGSIEVTKILGAHSAEARITSDDATNPLMPGDNIYSQIWNRGRQTGFAIAGFVDLDDDGRSDLERFQRIVAASHGKIDAVAGEDGKLNGKMTLDTRYLILGEYPDEPRKVGYTQSWVKASEQADTLGIDTIGLDEFLQLIGWQAESKTVKLGVGSRPEDFPARLEHGIQPTSPNTTSDLFRRRTPPPSY